MNMPAQTDLFGERPKSWFETTTARWLVDAGPFSGRRGVLLSSFDTEEGKRFGRVKLEDTGEIVVLPVLAFHLLMDTVFPPEPRPEFKTPVAAPSVSRLDRLAA